MKNNEFITSDLNLAAFLTKEFPIKEVVSKQDNFKPGFYRKQFVFQDDETGVVRSVAQDFTDRKCLIEPREYVDLIKQIKHLIYD